MKWQSLLDHLITVEGECMEENYGKGRALNAADEECNAGIRQGYAKLLKVRSILMAAPDLLDALQEAVRALNTAKRFRVGDTDSYAIAALCDKAIAKAEGRSE